MGRANWQSKLARGGLALLSQVLGALRAGSDSCPGEEEGKMCSG